MLAIDPQYARLSADERLPDVGLGLLLREADQSFNRMLRGKLGEHGVTFGQFQHLRHLWAEDGLTQVEISRRIGIEKASSTSIVDSLEKSGLITRQRDENDRRKMRIVLTPEGRGLERQLWDCARETNKVAAAGFAPGEIAALFAGLGRVIENLRAAEGK
jgi:DNA-binding MarR family transcriptional regulator